MKRTTILLAVLILILVLAGWYMFLFSPRSDALEEIETEIADVQAQQATQQARIAELQGIREQAPQLQAELAAAESLLPRDTALPSALRQLQQAADDSNATLVSISPARPEAIHTADPAAGTGDVYWLGLNAQLEGTYFQIIDVLRRLEDPTISPRGIVWDSAALTAGEELPELTVTLTGRMFSVLETTPEPGVETEPADPDADAADGDEDTDVDVDVDVDTEAEG